MTPSFYFEDYIDAGYAKAQETIVQYREGKLARLAGCNAEQTLESQMNGILGKVRNEVRARVCVRAHCQRWACVCRTRADWSAWCAFALVCVCVTHLCVCVCVCARWETCASGSCP